MTTLGGDALDLAVEEAVEHDVAGDHDPGPGQGLELGREIRVSGHTRPSARSRAPQNIWPRVMCIS